jgi:sugar phosphate permease
MRSKDILVGLRRRAWPLAAVPVTVAAGLGSRAVLGGLPAKVAGDALYTVLVYVLVLVVRPEASVRRAFVVALGVSFAIEFAQLSPYPAWLSSKHVLLRLIFGTTFGFVDLAGYVVGAVSAAALHGLVLRRSPA